MSSRIFLDSKAVELSRQLEIAILGERREDLLWRATQDRKHLELRDVELKESDKIAKELQNYTTSQEEILVLMEIEKSLENFKTITKEGHSIIIDKISLLADVLLNTINNYSEINKKQIDETMKASKSLNAFVDKLTLMLILIVGLIGVTGSIMLVKKIMRPVIRLNNAAERFGRGDLSIRIPIHTDDELGMLCKTFNNMAENISSLQKERLNFFASVVHDLKNPLIVIGGAARRIQKSKTNSAEGTNWLNCIIEQIANLENLINDLMDSIQVEMGKLKLNTVDLELASLIHSLQQIYDETIETHKILFIKEEECRINGDVKRLERVISNLISNAVKYSPLGTTILLKVARKGNNALITIIDEGAGISLNDTTKVFQPFERLDQVKGSAMGTGLGLFSAKTIIELHGGRIDIYRNVEKGTTVEITLPTTTHNNKEGIEV